MVLLVISKTAAVEIPGCVRPNSPNDFILDADVVRAQLLEGDRSGRCNFSNMGYTHVSKDAFLNSDCEVIDLSYNKLTCLDSDLFLTAFNLREIKLQYNNFVVAPKINNPTVEHINLNGNPIEQFPDNYTAGVPELRVLLVENCKSLLTISDKAFSCEFVKNESFTIRLNGTNSLENLPQSGFDYVNKTVTGVNPLAVMFTCDSGYGMTFESVSVELLNDTMSQTSPPTTKHKSDKETTPAVTPPPAEESTSETRNRSNDGKQSRIELKPIEIVGIVTVVGLVVGGIVVGFCWVFVGYRRKKNAHRPITINT